MSEFIFNIENETLSNENFRKVLITGTHAQLVVMTLLPGEEIGMEVHNDVDQFIHIETGVANAVIENVEEVIGPDFVVFIPAGKKHNIINISGTEKLRLYTLYSPAEHKDGTVHKTKADAALEK